MLLILPLVLVVGLLMIFTMASKSEPNASAPSPFECGFEPFTSNYMEFSLNYFMIIILFLVFDVEIILILPAMLTPTLLTYTSTFYMVSVLTWVFIISLLYESASGVLNWSH